jgi:hypothetical protein
MDTPFAATEIKTRHVLLGAIRTQALPLLLLEQSQYPAPTRQPHHLGNLPSLSQQLHTFDALRACNRPCIVLIEVWLAAGVYHFGNQLELGPFLRAKTWVVVFDVANRM